MNYQTLLPACPWFFWWRCPGVSCQINDQWASTYFCAIFQGKKQVRSHGSFEHLPRALTTVPKTQKTQPMFCNHLNSLHSPLFFQTIICVQITKTKTNFDRELVLNFTPPQVGIFFYPSPFRFHSMTYWYFISWTSERWHMDIKSFLPKSQLVSDA